ncbi:MAG TPA: ABC transporter ATP-binding protein [Phycisphaerales bacterium]|nr:ABC transporter ATP-binding protein [Phycisphaerales bacterium]
MIVLDSLRKSFGAITAVDDLSLSIEPGEVFGLLGPNGAGKSTTIAMTVGLLRPDSGSVRIDGGDPIDPGVRARIGVAPQTLALYEDLSARENLMFFGSLYGLDRAARARRADELLDLVGLTDRARDRVGKYSGGMKRRINLACALVHDPVVVLLDEPTAGVDPQSRHAIFEIVRALQAEGRTIVYTTHYMEEAQKLCARVGVIDRGRLLALDAVDGLIRAHGGESVVRIERAAGEERTQTAEPVAVIQRALAAGDALGIHVERPDLETVFLNLTGRSLRD